MSYVYLKVGMTNELVMDTMYGSVLRSPLQEVVEEAEAWQESTKMTNCR